MFKLGDTVKVCLNSTTIEGVLVREDQMGVTIQDIVNTHILRFVPWDCVVIIEYVK